MNFNIYKKFFFIIRYLQSNQVTIKYYGFPVGLLSFRAI